MEAATTTTMAVPTERASAWQYPTALGFMISGAAFMILGALAGLTAGTELIAPDIFSRWDNPAWLMFGRMRPMHTAMVAFGFVVTMMIGAGHYIVPRLCRVPLWSEKLGVLSMIVWDGALLFGVVGLALGYSQSREYAEMNWYADMGVTLAFVLFMVNMTMTVYHRKEKILYVSIWYFFGTWFLGGATYIIGNVIWVYPQGALYGMSDAVILWFYGHNILGLIITPLAVGCAYYVIPRAVKGPLYSHTLSHIGFWSIIVMYTHIGTHHLLTTPAPTWLKLISIVDSIGMLIPVSAVIVNLWMTAQGRMALLSKDIGARFVFVGTVLYLMTCIQGPMQSLPSVQRITHYTHWVPAHAHMAVLGFAGFIAFGTFYFVFERMTGRSIYSNGLAKLQYWFMLFGMAGKMSILTAAGLVQGYSWFHGQTVYRTLNAMHLFNFGRVISGVLVFTAALIGMYNVIRSLMGHRARYEREVAA